MYRGRCDYAILYILKSLNGTRLLRFGTTLNLYAIVYILKYKFIKYGVFIPDLEIYFKLILNFINKYTRNI